MSNPCEVLVIGAGPTGLVMAAELIRHGVPCRIVDKAAAPSRYSKALGIQARTLEVFAMMGVIEEILALGLKATSLNIYVRGQRLARLRLNQIESPYPFTFILAQSETERILERHLEQLGVKVEREIEAVSFMQDAAGVTTLLRYPDGHGESVRSPWLIGCDGAHSTVRHMLRFPFRGAPYPEEFLLADVQVHWPYPKEEEVRVFLGQEGILGFLPLGQGLYRLVATSHPSLAQSEEPSLAEIQSLVKLRGPADTTVSHPEWLARFRVHRRIVPSYRAGRVFLAGDAAHIHSPAGGQGMNTGIQDAFNLAWKLGLVISGVAAPTLLDTYDQERRPVGESVLQMTDRLTNFITLHDPLAQQARNTLLFTLLNQEFMQRPLLQAMAELTVNYRQSPIVGEFGGIFIWESLFRKGGLEGGMAWLNGPHAGDRAPDAYPLKTANGAPIHLFDLLRETRHILLLFSDLQPRAELQALSEGIQRDYGSWIAPYWVMVQEKIPAEFEGAKNLLLDPDRALHHRYGVVAPCLYLIRPDGYVGFRSQTLDRAALYQYLGRILKQPVAAPV